MTSKKKRHNFFSIKQISLLLLISVLMTAALSFQVFAEKESVGKTVRVGWFESAYNIKDESGRKSGYAYEYQRKVAAYTGWTYEYVEDSWPNLIKMLENGEIDLLSDVSYTEERAEKMLFPSYEMGTEEYYLYISADKINDYHEDLSYFDGKKIGVNKSSIQIEIFKGWEKNNGVNAELVEMTGSEQESISKLVNGELDVYLTLDTYHSMDTIIPVVKIGSSDFYFAVNKSRPDLLNELNAAMSKIQDENRFYSHELYDRYLQTSGANLFLSSEEKAWLYDNGAIRVGYLDNYLAYCETDSGTKELTGALKDYLEKASKCLANATLQFETAGYPTVEKALEALRSGEVDCVFPANFSNYDGENSGVILTPAITRAALFTVFKSSEQQTFTNKEDVKVAVSPGETNYVSIIRDYYPGWEIVECSDIQDCLKSVADGKTDCFLISSYRYNHISRLCEKYKLTSLDTGNDIPVCFAVKEGNTNLYSILAKTTNVIPDSYTNTLLMRYFSEEGKPTLIDFLRENTVIVIAVAAVIAALILLIIVQSRLIKAEKNASENRRIADDLSRRVYVDSLTSVRNKHGYTDYMQMLQQRVSDGEVTEFAVCMFDCDDLKYVNDKYGHKKGDEYLKTAASLICHIFQHSPVFRVGGDEFISVLQNDDYHNSTELIKRFYAESEENNKTAQNEWEKINVSYGMAKYDSKTDKTIEDTASRADSVMYENKRKRKVGRD